MADLKQIYNEAVQHTHDFALSAVAAKVREEVAAEYEKIKNDAVNAVAGVDVGALQAKETELSTALETAQAEVTDLKIKLQEAETEITNLNTQCEALTKNGEALMKQADINAAAVTAALQAKVDAFNTPGQITPQIPTGAVAGVAQSGQNANVSQDAGQPAASPEGQPIPDPALATSLAGTAP